MKSLLIVASIFICASFNIIPGGVEGVPSLQIKDARLEDDNDNFQSKVDLKRNNGSAVLADSTYRLPRSLVPSNYRLQIRPVLTEETGNGLEQFSAPGVVTITFKAAEVTNRIVLHSLDVEIDEAAVVIRSQGGSDLPIINPDSHSYDLERQFYIIQLSDNLNAEWTYELDIPFKSQIDQTELAGLYLSYYDYTNPTTGEIERRNLATTQFQPTDARQVFPCFDEPEWKATLEISVAKKTGHTALSNMDVREEVPDTEYAGWQWVHFNPTPVRLSTYLVAIIVSDFGFKEAEEKFGTKPIRTYAAQYLIDQQGGDFAAQAALDIIKYYQGFTEVDYALPKLDSVAIPQFSAGAMENWGLNTYRTEYLIHIPGENTETERKKISQVLSHEITHQWFGNLVTCNWWSYTWLNEGFARFLQYRGMNAAAPELDTLIAIVSDATQLGMTYDHGPNSHPVVQDVYSPDEISNHFSRMTYDKGASLLRMMEGVFTTEVFDNSLRDYLNGKIEDTAVSSDLFDSFQKLGQDKLPTGVRIHDIMETWTSQLGYPLVRVSVAGDNKVFLTQEKFKLNSGAKQHPANTGAWYIPVKIVSASNPVFTDKSPNVWIPNDRALISFTDAALDTKQWLIVNPDLSGYYRVLYDSSLKKLIKAQLDADLTKISDGTRSQLLDDYFNFANEGYAPIESALELTTFLAKERALVVWAPLLTHIRTIFNRFTADDSDFANFKDYFSPKFAGALDLIGWEQAENEKGADVILRAQLLDFACVFGEAKCVSYAKSLFDAWDSSDPTKRAIPADIRPVVFCSAVAEGDQAVWDRAYDQYQKESSVVTKAQILKALACSKQLPSLYSFLELALDGTSGLNIVPVAQSVAGNSIGRQAVYNHAKTNFGPTTPIDPGQFASIIGTLSSYWNKQSDIDDLQAFIDLHRPDFTDASLQSLNASIARVRANIVWDKQFGRPISAWLQKN